MIDFLKMLWKKMRTPSKNKEIKKWTKILYTIIFICAIIFIVILIKTLINAWPDIVSSIQYDWNESKSIIKIPDRH